MSDDPILDRFARVESDDFLEHVTRTLRDFPLERIAGLAVIMLRHGDNELFCHQSLTKGLTIYETGVIIDFILDGLEQEIMAMSNDTENETLVRVIKAREILNLNDHTKMLWSSRGKAS